MKSGHSRHLATGLFWRRLGPPMAKIHSTGTSHCCIGRKWISLSCSGPQWPWIRSLFKFVTTFAGCALMTLGISLDRWRLTVYYYELSITLFSNICDDSCACFYVEYFCDRHAEYYVCDRWAQSRYLARIFWKKSQPVWSPDHSLLWNWTRVEFWSHRMSAAVSTFQDQQ